MENFYIIFIIGIVLTFLGIKNIIFNSKKNIKYYYSGIDNLISGIPLTILMIIYYFNRNQLLLIIGFGFCLLTSGFYGIWNRKKIKNQLSFRMDVFAFIGGILILVYLIIYKLNH